MKAIKIEKFGGPEVLEVKDIEIGKIEILRNFSFFEVDKEFEQLILDSFKDSSFSGTKLTVQLAKPADSSNDRQKWTKRKDNRKDSRKRYHRDR